MPIHAAGLYYNNAEKSDVTLADFVVSSYTPTLTALVKANQIQQKTSCKLLTVIQPNTPKQPPLPGTEKELEIVQKHMGHIPGVSLVGSQATVSQVLEAMKECSWAHLACHGMQDFKNPAETGLLLQDGRLKISDLITQNLPHADFAFLSACQTAMGDTENPDEAIHIAAGMLMAGYKSIIATMWSIRDDDAYLIADIVYSHLSQGEPDSSKAARALHEATQSLRKRYNNCTFSSWVPYIHVGI